MNPSLWVRLLIAVGAVGLLLASPASTFAAAGLQSSGAMLKPCGGKLEELRRLEDRIRGASTLEAARMLAMQPLNGAAVALKRAQRLAPWSTELSAARAQLRDYEARVHLAAEPEAVAAQFAALGRLTGSRSVDARLPARVNGGCDYSTGEIIAIVLGFLLGIIPGIILLILLC